MLDNLKLNLTFIGAGNMAASLVHGLLGNDMPANQITVADPFPEQLDKFSALGVNSSTDNDRAVTTADVVILAVKPQIAGKVLGALTLRPEQLLVSIAAGIDLASLRAWSNEEQPIVRCMPNTPALLGAGMTGLFANSQCSDGQRAIAQTVLQAAGKTLWVADEKQLDAVTAVSGSGPAYFFLLMEAMIEAGRRLGLDAETARALTIQTALGAARMAAESNDPPDVLRSNVTSPGGTTAAALQVMLDAGLTDTVGRALLAADQRAAELSVEFGATTTAAD